MAESRESWSALLDELDRQLVRSHPEFGLGNQPSGIWGMSDILASFGDLGAMPQPLVARAAGIAAKYDDAFVRINAAKRVVGDHLDMLQSVKGIQNSTPVYIDRVG